MTRICGYDCKHNKSGVCQVTICDKRSYITDNTNDTIINKENEKVFEEIFNKSVERLLNTLNNNPDELFDVKNMSKQLAEKSKKIYSLKRENTNLKQALIDIKGICVSNMIAYENDGDCGVTSICDGFQILQIIDKVLGDE